MSGFDAFPTSFGKKTKVAPKPTAQTEKDAWNELQSLMKGGFGSKTKSSKPNLPMKPLKEPVQDDDDVGPPIPQTIADDQWKDIPTKDIQRKDTSDSHDKTSDESEEEQYDSSLLPITKNCTISEHERSITSLTMDRVGDRLLTGSTDTWIKFYNFSTMDASMKSFKRLEPMEGIPIRELAFSTSGDKFLLVTTAPFVKLYDRDGMPLAEFSKGDPYMTDMRHTKGHVGPVTSVQWHPYDKSRFITSSSDSTVRIWDAHKPTQQKEVIVIKNRGKGTTGQRTLVASCSYSKDGKWIAAGSVDGCLRLFPGHGPYVHAAHTVEKAHSIGAEVGSISWNSNNVHFCTRAMDDTVKLWDVRSLKAPAATLEGLMSSHTEMNVVYSPDEQLLVTGTSAKSKQDGQGGKLLFLNKTTLAPVRSVDVGSGISVCKVLWHPRINQILAGCSDGKVRVFWDDAVSVRGAILCQSKVTKRKAAEDIDYTANSRIFVPGTADDEFLPNHKGEIVKKRVKKPVRLPEQDMALRGSGGKTGITTVEAAMNSLRGGTVGSHMFSDPREAMLRHAEEAEKNPMFVGQAYTETQPKTIFDYDALQHEADNPKTVKRHGQAPLSEDQKKKKNLN